MISPRPDEFAVSAATAVSHIEVIVGVVANEAATSVVDIDFVVAVASVDALALAVVEDRS